MIPVEVSVIVPTINYGRFIKRAIESIYFQNFPKEKIEVIVVDGKSTDNTFEILKEYENKNNFFIYTQEKKGISNAVNIGIEKSKGKYILRLDADDAFYQNIIYKEYKILEKNLNVDFAYPDYNYYLLEEEKWVRKYLPKFSKDEIIRRGDFLSGGTMFRKTIFKKYGDYDETIPTLDCYELILRLMKNNVMGYHIPEPLFEYTIHGSSLSDNTSLIEKTQNEIAQKYNIKFQKNINHPRNIYSK